MRTTTLTWTWGFLGHYAIRLKAHTCHLPPRGVRRPASHSRDSEAIRRGGDGVFMLHSAEATCILRAGNASRRLAERAPTGLVFPARNSRLTALHWLSSVATLR